MNHGISPKQPGSPVPRTVRGFGVASKVSDERRCPPTKYREVGIDYSSRRGRTARGDGDARVARALCGAARSPGAGGGGAPGAPPRVAPLHGGDHEPLDLGRALEQLVDL